MNVPNAEAQPTMTIPDAARVLGISRESAYRAARRGEIPCLKFGDRMVVPTAELRRMLGMEP